MTRTRASSLQRASSVRVGDRLGASDGRGRPIVLTVTGVRVEGDLLAIATEDGAESFVDAADFVEVVS